jgi:hypothetical protein
MHESLLAFQEVLCFMALVAKMLQAKAEEFENV